jgi:hypothetical protein
LSPEINGLFYFHSKTRTWDFNFIFSSTTGMNWFKNTSNLVFSGFLVSVVLVFFYIRPLNSSWDRFINGDGLGYYSYLPAKYIYNDTSYEFKWFNGVFHEHYAQSSFPNPEDNFMVNYGNKRINKYYPGLSCIWLPFFIVAHLCARSLSYPADGFSEPYQLAIGLASLVYLLIGLIYLRKLLQKLFHNSFVSLLVPMAVFYGTHLFSIALRYNSLTHVYSFTFLTLFANALVSYFNQKDKRLHNLLFCVLWLIISVCIRPLTGLVVLLVPAFFPNGFFKERLRFEKIKFLDLVILVLMTFTLYHQFSIIYTQTRTLVPYTYAGEQFHFDRSMFFEAMIGYRIGLFVYAPVLFVSLFGIPWLSSRRRVILPAFFLAILFLYSCWWYWPIVKRTMVDFYFIPAIFLGSFLNRFHQVKQRAITLVLLGLCILYYQLKNFQMSRGILDEYYTYKEVFWRNFLRTDKASMFLVPPASILKEESARQEFETDDSLPGRVKEKSYKGQYSLLLDDKNYISKIAEQPFPTMFKDKGINKIRVSFWSHASGSIGQVHLFFQFLNEDGKQVSEVPFYLNEESILKDRWDYKEFGIDLTDFPEIDKNQVSKLSVVIWNVASKGKLFIDDVQLDFMVTDPGYEITK